MGSAEKTMPSNVVTFPARQIPVHTIRSREKVLGLLLPKFLGVLWARGEATERGVKALVSDDLEISAFQMVPGAYCAPIGWLPTALRKRCSQRM